MVEIIFELLNNKILLSVIIACFVAQGLKPFIRLVKKGVFEFKEAFNSGGMPSSHTASISAVATSLYLLEGVSNLFIFSFVIAVVIFIDAVRVRQAVGKQADLLNKISKKLDFNSKRLRELIGHTPLEALVGVVLGVLIALIVNLI